MNYSTRFCSTRFIINADLLKGVFAHLGEGFRGWCSGDSVEFSRVDVELKFDVVKSLYDLQRHGLFDASYTLVKWEIGEEFFNFNIKEFKTDVFIEALTKCDIRSAIGKALVTETRHKLWEDVSDVEELVSAVCFHIDELERKIVNAVDIAEKLQLKMAEQLKIELDAAN